MWEKNWNFALKYKIQQKEKEIKEFVNLFPENPVILEIGAYNGGTTALFSCYAKELITIEPVIRFDRSEIDAQCYYYQYTYDSHNPHCLEAIKEIISEVDVLFIDGDHSYEGSKQDYEMYKDLVKEGGIIGFHDIVDSEEHRKANCFVSKTWNEIKNNYRHLEFIDGGIWAGIGVLFKGNK